MRDRFLKVMVMASYFSVALFCLFSLCSFFRLVWVLPILAVFFIIREKQDAICRVMGCFGAWMQKHKCLILGVVVIMAVLVRVLFYLFAISDLDAFQNSDSRVFVARARELLCGEFPNVKSWVTCGIHALRIGILGDSTWGIPIVNFLFQVLGAWVMFVALERPFGRIVAFCASMLYLFHPSSILLTFRALSEPFFFVLLFSALYFLYELILDKKIKSAIMFTVMAWLSIWTRGEGLLLFGVFCVCALVGGGFLRGARVGAVFAEIGGSVFVLSLFFAGVALWANVQYHGEWTCFCSNDSYWPRLCGSNVLFDGRSPLKQIRESKGYVGRSDKEQIVDRYLWDHPYDADKKVLNLLPQTCPQVLVPYIRAEISRRWRSLDMSQKGIFVVRKLWYPFCNTYCGSGQLVRASKSRRKNIMWRLYYEFLPTVVLLSALMYLVKEGKESFQNREDVGATSIVRLVPCVFELGMVCVIAIGESNIRYGIVSVLMLAPYGFRFIQERLSECRELSR